MRPWAPDFTCITKLSESQTSDQTIIAIAGHVSRRMLEHYSRIRTDAKRTALDAIAQGPKQAILGIGVHQNVHQLEEISLKSFHEKADPCQEFLLLFPCFLLFFPVQPSRLCRHPSIRTLS